METCKYGSGADKRKPTAVKRKGVVYRAYKSPTKRRVGTWWKSHATLTLLATQDLPTFGYNMIDPLKSWCWGSILFYPFKISRFS